ncbi:MAG: hypothetical protein AAFX51_10465, partial [Cyanobacteria bacterium J06636_28]
MAVLALAVFATPLAAQEPSLENSESVEDVSPVLPDSGSLDQELPVDVSDPAAEATTDPAL